MATATETVWRQADKFMTPELCFINKLDRMGASFDFCQLIRYGRNDSNAVALQIPVGQKVILEELLTLSI